MKTPAKQTVQKLGLKLAVALALAATPLVPFGVVSFGDAPVTIAGGSNIDDVDPG